MAAEMEAREELPPALRALSMPEVLLCVLLRVEFPRVLPLAGVSRLWRDLLAADPRLRRHCLLAADRTAGPPGDSVEYRLHPALAGLGPRLVWRTGEHPRHSFFQLRRPDGTKRAAYMLPSSASSQLALFPHPGRLMVCARSLSAGNPAPGQTPGEDESNVYGFIYEPLWFEIEVPAAGLTVSALMAAVYDNVREWQWGLHGDCDWFAGMEVRSQGFPVLVAGNVNGDREDDPTPVLELVMGPLPESCPPGEGGGCGAMTSRFAAQWGWATAPSTPGPLQRLARQLRLFIHRITLRFLGGPSAPMLPPELVLAVFELLDRKDQLELMLTCARHCALGLRVLLLDSRVRSWEVDKLAGMGRTVVGQPAWELVRRLELDTDVLRGRSDSEAVFAVVLGNAEEATLVFSQPRFVGVTWTQLRRRCPARVRLVFLGDSVAHLRRGELECPDFRHLELDLRCTACPCALLRLLDRPGPRIALRLDLQAEHRIPFADMPQLVSRIALFETAMRLSLETKFDARDEAACGLLSLANFAPRAVGVRAAGHVPYGAPRFWRAAADLDGVGTLALAGFPLFAVALDLVPRVGLLTIVDPAPDAWEVEETAAAAAEELERCRAGKVEAVLRERRWDWPGWRFAEWVGNRGVRVREEATRGNLWGGPMDVVTWEEALCI
ncbi:hypothetical protein DFJ74DRAFT_646820 [Hyaloraphidium curvatum]|nr:hypothetical protein DFJ74DRAFT_646820 [Hyaloraphidium curvatum]